MRSLWIEQTIKPDEIILVEDGPLTEELYAIIDIWKNNCGIALKPIALEKNVGLGDALNIGLQNCSHELVARMDTDDICIKNRFEKQIEVFRKHNIDICSSWVGEFENDENEMVSYRKVPQEHNEIIRYAKKRNPINHPAVMYKKQAVNKAGGYQKMMWFEDYYLWVRMILSGAKFFNLQEALVNMRAGYGQLERRTGLKYAVSELKLQKIFLNMKFINILNFFINVTIRFITRISPKKVLKKIYCITRS
jgi:glycosyltransferase involved in cell wall biosynthesis